MIEDIFKEENEHMLTFLLNSLQIFVEHEKCRDSHELANKIDQKGDYVLNSLLTDVILLESSASFHKCDRQTQIEITLMAIQDYLGFCFVDSI